MAISIMNSSTSGNSPHGLNKAEANTFSYWQYVDTLVYWGGSSGEGLIVAPSPDVVDAGHKNGVRVIGTVFMPMTAHGGKMEWLEDLLTKADDGSYPVADKRGRVCTPPRLPSENCQLCPLLVPYSPFRYSTRSSGVFSCE